MRSKKHLAILDGLAREYLNAPIDETIHQYRNEFRRHYRTVGVELCHGDWHTFSRYGAQPDPHVVKHESREAARAYALQVLGA
jgi:hypothetical protein